MSFDHDATYPKRLYTDCIEIKENKGSICCSRRETFVRQTPKSWKREDRIRISESVQWRDQALNDYTGNLTTGVLGMKKHIHAAPVKRRKSASLPHRLYHKRRGAKNVTCQSQTESEEESSRDGGNEKAQVSPVGTRETPYVDEPQTNSEIREDESVMKERKRQPVITDVGLPQAFSQKPTVELDISSDEESEVPEEKPRELHSKSKPLLSDHHHYSSRLFDDANVRPDGKHLASAGQKRSPLRECPQRAVRDLWSTRGETLLGYDFVSGSVDNLKFLRKVPRNFDEMKEFRNINRNECAAANDNKYHGNFEEQSKDDVDSHHCLHSYRINDRLFAEATDVDRQGRSMCSICLLLRERSSHDQPTHISVSMPGTVPQVSMPRCNRKFSSMNKNSLALLKNCDFANG